MNYRDVPVNQEVEVKVFVVFAEGVLRVPGDPQKADVEEKLENRPHGDHSVDETRLAARRVHALSANQTSAGERVHSQLDNLFAQRSHIASDRVTARAWNMPKNVHGHKF